MLNMIRVSPHISEYYTADSWIDGACLHTVGVAISTVESMPHL